jgi:Zn-dependent peptidase ImmA (M78 family)
MAQVEALVTPSVMRWARESAGLSVIEASNKIKRPIEEIMAWEKGVQMPTIPQARRASEIYRRPLAVFYLPEPPLDFDTLRDFRRLPNEEERFYSKKLTELIRTAYEHQYWANEYLKKEGISPLSYVGSACLEDNPKDIAKQILTTFMINPNDQCSVPSRFYALKLWIEKAESKGVFIFRKGSIDLHICRGFILSDNIAPFIYLNSEDAYAGMMFTLVHELAHLWLNISGISNLNTYGRFISTEDLNIEKFCNRVASEALIYSERFEREIEDLSIALTTEERIEILSRIFKVSEEAIARKMLEYDYISSSKYVKLRDLYQKRWLNLKRKEKQKNKERDGGPSYYVTKISNNGLLYTQTVIGAYQGGHILGRDASSLLEVKINNLSKLAGHAGIPMIMEWN